MWEGSWAFGFGSRVLGLPERRWGEGRGHGVAEHHLSLFEVRGRRTEALPTKTTAWNVCVDGNLETGECIG